MSIEVSSELDVDWEDLSLDNIDDELFEAIEEIESMCNNMIEALIESRCDVEDERDIAGVVHYCLTGQ